MIGRAWCAARIARAQELRARLYQTPYYRLVHAEADGLPGVVIDRFGEAAVLQPNAAWADRMTGDLAAALADVTGCTTIVKNGSGRARALEGLPEETAVTAPMMMVKAMGEKPVVVAVEEKLRIRQHKPL